MQIQMVPSGSERIFTVAKIFIDTNIFVYTMDQHNLTKRNKCRDLLKIVDQEHVGVISTQVMLEFFVAATKKLNTDPSLMKNILHSLLNFDVVIITPELIEVAIDIQISNKLSFWDSMIIASAEHAKCNQLWTEDLNYGQVVRGVRIINPLK